MRFNGNTSTNNNNNNNNNLFQQSQINSQSSLGFTQQSNFLHQQSNMNQQYNRVTPNGYYQANNINFANNDYSQNNLANNNNNLANNNNNNTINFANNAGFLPNNYYSQNNNAYNSNNNYFQNNGYVQNMHNAMNTNNNCHAMNNNNNYHQIEAVLNILQQMNNPSAPSSHINQNQNPIPIPTQNQNPIPIPIQISNPVQQQQPFPTTIFRSTSLPSGPPTVSDKIRKTGQHMPQAKIKHKRWVERAEDLRIIKVIRKNHDEDCPGHDGRCQFHRAGRMIDNVVKQHLWCYECEAGFTMNCAAHGTNHLQSRKHSKQLEEIKLSYMCVKNPHHDYK